MRELSLQMAQCVLMPNEGNGKRGGCGTHRFCTEFRVEGTKNEIAFHLAAFVV